MALRIVHFAITPLAGQPYRLVNALQRFSDHDVRLVDLRRRDIYPHDLIFSEDAEQCIALAQTADIIHFHNCYDINLNSKFFSPLNFNDLAKKGTDFICQFHSEPSTVARIMGTSIQDVLSCKLPSLVIAQYPERYFINAQVVPNNLPINSSSHLPTKDMPIWDIFFGPSRKSSAWVDRWNTKGAPETIRLMEGIAKRTGCTFKVASGQPLSKVLKEKKRAYLVLDELITGSYHLSGLEGLSMAKPTLTYLDERIQRVLLEVSGADSIPFINVRLENAAPIIEYLLQHRDDGSEIGVQGRNWLEKYWSEERIVQLFNDIYKNLMDNSGLINRQKPLRLDRETARFRSVILPDLVYQSRKTQAIDLSYSISNLYNVLKLKWEELLQEIRRVLVQLLPKQIRNWMKNLVDAKK